MFSRSLRATTGAALRPRRAMSAMAGVLSDEHRMLREMCRKYADEELKHAAGALDKEHRFPREHVEWMGQNGLMGVSVDAETGGSGMDYLAYAIGMEEISRGCASCGVIMSVNNVRTSTRVGEGGMRDAGCCCCCCCC